MTSINDYIRIALSKAGGDRARATQALMVLALKDEHFAQLLLTPQLEQVAAQAINTYLGEEAPAPAAPKPVASEASTDHRAAVLKMVNAFKKRDA